MSIVRNNLMTQLHYTPYCGQMDKRCSMPRTRFNGRQFVCPECGWVSGFDAEFINQYKTKWDIK